MHAHDLIFSRAKTAASLKLLVFCFGVGFSTHYEQRLTYSSLFV
jgi:hypothetical protein